MDHDVALEGSSANPGPDVRFDVAIIGGGPAGLSAAITLGRALRRVIVIDAGTPRNAPASNMHAFLGHDGRPPLELLEQGRAEIASYGVAFREDRVIAVSRQDDDHGTSFTLEVESGLSIDARRVLFAVGAQDVLPDIPGLVDVWGQDVHVCPYCHGWEVRGMPLAVIATGEHSAMYALLIRNWTDDLLYFEHDQEPLSDDEVERFDAMGIRRVPGLIRRAVIDNGLLTGIEMESGERLDRTAVFFPTRLEPDTTLLQSLGVALPEKPQGPVVEVDSLGRTSVAGVWAAGNVTNPSLQVVGAAAEGNAAGGGINMELILEDVKRRMRKARIADVVQTQS